MGWEAQTLHRVGIHIISQSAPPSPRFWIHGFKKPHIMLYSSSTYWKTACLYVDTCNANTCWSILLFVAAMQGTPLNHLALEARGACFPESPGIVTIREIVEDLEDSHPQGPMKGLGRHGGWWMQSLCTPSASLQLTSILQKEAYTLLWCPDLGADTRGQTTLCCLTLMDSETTAHRLHRTLSNRERVLERLPPCSRTPGNR